MSDAIHDAAYTSFCFAYFTDDSAMQPYNPLDAAKYYEFPGGNFQLASAFPAFDLDFAFFGITIGDLEGEGEMSFEDYQTLLETTPAEEAGIQPDPRPEVRSFKIVTKQPLVAAWSIRGIAATDPMHAWKATAQQMQIPDFDRSMGTSEFLDRDKFDAFRRTNCLVMSGLPAFTSDGFIDQTSDFTYTNLRTLWGIGSGYSTPPGGGDSYAVPTIFKQIRTADFFALEHATETSGFSEYDRLHWDIQMDGSLPTIKQGRKVAQSIYQNSAKPHYLACKVFSAQVDFHYQRATNGIISDFGYDTYGDPMGWVGQFDMEAEATGPKPLNYKIAASRCGTLKTFGNVYSPDISAPSYDTAELHTTRFDAVTKLADHNITELNMPGLKLRDAYPLPLDGNPYYWRWSRDPAHGAEVINPSFTVIERPADDAPAEAFELWREHHDAKETGTYKMFWENDGPDVYTARPSQIIQYSFRYGTPHLSFISLFNSFQSKIRMLQDSWNYDDTPLMARIRTQPAQKFDLSLLTSLSAGYDKETFAADAITDTIAYDDSEVHIEGEDFRHLDLDAETEYDSE